VLGELREGDTLPPETTLMGQFGVSRPTLREAFRILETESLISVRRGAREVRGCVCPLSDACTERRSYGMKRVLIRRRRSIACLFPPRRPQLRPTWRFGGSWVLRPRL